VRHALTLTLSLTLFCSRPRSRSRVRALRLIVKRYRWLVVHETKMLPLRGSTASPLGASAILPAALFECSQQYCLAQLHLPYGNIQIVFVRGMCVCVCVCMCAYVYVCICVSVLKHRRYCFLFFVVHMNTNTLRINTTYYSNRGCPMRRATLPSS